MTFSELKELLVRNRTYRIFNESVSIDRSVLIKLVELCRFTASGRNAQPLKYRLVTDKEECEALFPLLVWAGYYKDWDGPARGQRPSAYLVQCLDTHYGPNCLCDDGLQLEAITLGAATMGLGSCIIKSFKINGLKDALSLPKGIEPRYVVALGQPAENVVIEQMDGTKEADYKYYRTEDGTHHVPKRPLEELIID